MLGNADKLNRSISEIMVSHLGHDIAARPIDKLRSSLTKIVENKI